MAESPKTLREWRRERGLTLMQVAIRAGLSLATVEGTENARSLPSVTTAIQIAQALGVAVEQIVWSAPTRQPPSKRDRGKVERNGQ